jgi:hypothetical protein
MTLDEQIRSTMTGAASAAPSRPPAHLEDITRRGRRRLVRRRSLWGVASAVVVLGFLAFTIPFDPNPISPADLEDVATVEVADLAVAVTTEDPISTDPDIWIGLPGPAPLFDASAFGPDLSFASGEPVVGDLDNRIERGVFLGELDGEPFYLFSAPAPSIWDRIFEVIDGNLSGDTLGTTLNCCSGGDMDHEGGLPGFSHSSSSEGGVITEETIVAEWLGLSLDVSVVAYELDGEFVGWQRPVGGTSSITPERVPSDITYIAFDATGRELDRFTTSMSQPPEGTAPASFPALPGDDWAPMTNRGEEIEIQDIPSASLRARIDPRPEDRLFLVPVEGGELIVRVSEGAVHAFAESCSVLAAAGLPPGWSGTCLD